MGEDLKKGVRSIKEVVTFDEEEITDEILQNRLNEFTGKIDDMAKLYKKAAVARRKVREVSLKKKPKDHRRARRKLARGHRCDLEGGAQTRIHQRRAQAPDRAPQQDGRRHAFARPPDARTSSARPTPLAAKNKKKNIAGRRAPSAAKLKNSNSKPDVLVPGAQAHAARNHPGRHGRGAGQARADRGQPPTGGFDREKIHQPRPAVSRPDSGRQHRPDESRRQIRIPPRLQIFHVCHVVDSPGHHPCHRRSGPHDPHPGAHDRNHQQADPHIAATGSGTGTRTDQRKKSRSAWTFRLRKCAKS